MSYDSSHGRSQLSKDGEPQVYCADCFYYGDGRTFPGDEELDIVQCPSCMGEHTFALTKQKKDEIDAMACLVSSV